MILYTLEDKDSSYNLQSINNKIAEAEKKLKIKKKEITMRKVLW